MKIVAHSAKLEFAPSYNQILDVVTSAGRTCYKSENQGTPENQEQFLRSIIKRGHLSVIEHVKISVRVITDRGTSHQLVRHRTMSFSQESTRYCNYSKDKFDGEVSYIAPYFRNVKNAEKLEKIWYEQAAASEQAYFELLELGALPEEARSVLPHSLKTELVMTTDLRNWRHFLELRLAPDAQREVRLIAQFILHELYSHAPVFFEDIMEQYGKDKEAILK